MIPVLGIAQALYSGWSLLRMARPDAAGKLIQAVLNAKSTADQNNMMTSQMNALANGLAAFRHYKGIAAQSTDPNAIAAFNALSKELGEAIAKDQEDREAMFKEKFGTS